MLQVASLRHVSGKPNIASQWRVLSERFSTHMVMEWYLDVRPCARLQGIYNIPATLLATTSDTNTRMRTCPVWKRKGTTAYREVCVIVSFRCMRSEPKIPQPSFRLILAGTSNQKY